MTQKIKCNLSASSIATYENSPLEFYFKYIIKAPADTKVNMSYGDAGSVVHALAEKYIKDNRNKESDYKNLFEESWKKYNLDNVNGFNGKPLDKHAYYIATQNTFNFIDNTGIDSAEHNFLFPLINDERAEINIKGFVDAIDTKNHIIYDWKTNSSIKDFHSHALMYCYAYWKEFGSIPKALYYYSILNKTITYSFSESQLQAYDKRLKYIAEDILQKGFDVELYEPRKWEHTFNSHAKACEEHVRKRKESMPILYDIIANHIVFKTKLPEKLNIIIDKKFSYDVKGKEFSKAYQTKLWDGRVHLYNTNRQILPIGLFSAFTKLLEDYNEHFRTRYVLQCNTDSRIPLKKSSCDFVLNEKYALRYYQEDAIQSALDNKICILELGTGAGKSLISAEIIRRLKVKSLYVINRIELVKQTAEMFKDYLGVECNTIYDGEINVVDPDAITVVSVQSIVAILKRNDNTTKKLLELLHSVGVVIYDECHGATDSGSYGTLAKTLINAHYIIGTTGTSFRADEHTMRMTALVGDVAYRKTTKELVEESFLVPTICKFIKNDTKLNQVIEEDVDIDEEIYIQNKTYHDEYEMLITKSATRNGLIKDIVEKNKDKKILILTKLIKHGEVLNELIEHSRLITSQTGKQDRSDDFDAFKDNKYNVLIGSMQIFSTGINLPNLDLIINASGNKTDVGTIQSIGRIMRKSNNKSVAYYYDFYDLGSRYFTSASRQRMKILGDFGHNIEILQAVE